MTNNNGKYWIGVDLDGILAYYDDWRGAECIGMPILPMVDKVKSMLNAGVTVKIFTARAHIPEQIQVAWCKTYLGRELEVTASKDYYMLELWDDKAVPVQTNTGEFKKYKGLEK